MQIKTFHDRIGRMLNNWLQSFKGYV